MKRTTSILILLLAIASMAWAQRQEARKAWLSASSLSYSHYDLEKHELHNVNLDITIHCPTAELEIIFFYVEEYGIKDEELRYGYHISCYEKDDESVFFDEINSQKRDYELDWNAKIWMDLYFVDVGIIRTDTIAVFDLIQDEEVKAILLDYDRSISTHIQPPPTQPKNVAPTYSISGQAIPWGRQGQLYIQGGKKYLIRRKH